MHGIADRQHAFLIQRRRRNAENVHGLGESSVINRRIGFAGLNDVPARCRIGFGQYARAIDELVADFDDDIGIGAIIVSARRRMVEARR